MNADGPVSFFLEDVMDQPLSPSFLKVNYSAGVREILMTTLWNADRPMGFIHIYSDRPDSFTTEFRNIIKGILPQLSGAVSNIIKNEELLKKENEKSLLLDFSNDITRVKDKEDLAAAVRTTLGKINPGRGYVSQSTFNSLYVVPHIVFSLNIVKIRNTRMTQSIDYK